MVLPIKKWTLLFTVNIIRKDVNQIDNKPSPAKVGSNKLREHIGFDQKKI